MSIRFISVDLKMVPVNYLGDIVKGFPIIFFMIASFCPKLLNDQTRCIFQKCGIYLRQEVVAGDVKFLF